MSSRQQSQRSLRDLSEKITLRTYKQFDRWIEIIGKKAHRLIMLAGDPGLGKTYMLRAALQDPEAWIHGQLEAAIDRGVVVYLQFTPQEVHNKAGSWFLVEPDLAVKREIYGFIGDHLTLIERPSFRHYVTAYEHHLAGSDWRAFLFELW